MTSSLGRLAKLPGLVLSAIVYLDLEIKSSEFIFEDILDRLRIWILKKWFGVFIHFYSMTTGDV